MYREVDVSRDLRACEVLSSAAYRLWEANKKRLDSEPWYNLFLRRRLRRELENSERMYFWAMDMYYETYYCSITEK